MALKIEISEPDLEYLEQVAQRAHCTLEEAAERVVHDAVHAQQQWEYLKHRAKRGEGKWPEFRELLAKAPDLEPSPEDRLPAAGEKSR